MFISDLFWVEYIAMLIAGFTGNLLQPLFRTSWQCVAVKLKYKPCLKYL
jgi:hypothetical protein